MEHSRCSFCEKCPLCWMLNMNSAKPDLLSCSLDYIHPFPTYEYFKSLVEALDALINWDISGLILNLIMFWV